MRCRIAGCKIAHAGDSHKNYCAHHFALYGTLNNRASREAIKARELGQQCAVIDCERTYNYAGWCAYHMHVLHRHGNPFGNTRVLPRRPADPLFCQECSADAVVGGYCVVHYEREDDGSSKCVVVDCEDDYRSAEFCNRHYRQAKRSGLIPGDECKIADCPCPVDSNGMCVTHYMAARNTEETERRRERRALVAA